MSPALAITLNLRPAPLNYNTMTARHLRFYPAAAPILVLERADFVSGVDPSSMKGSLDAAICTSSAAHLRANRADFFVLIPAFGKNVLVNERYIWAGNHNPINAVRSAMNKPPQSPEALRAIALSDIEKSLAEFFDAEEHRIERISFRNLGHKELAETRRQVHEVLFDIRVQALLRISIEIRDLLARQDERPRRAAIASEHTHPVGKRLILQCLAKSDDLIAN